MFAWGTNRRFNAYSDYFKKEFGERVQKLSVDAGFTCPNRDGTAGHGGCTYCVNDAFNPSYCHPSKSVSQQLAEGIQFHKNRYRRADKYLAYFQAYSNTYASLPHLKEIYEEALSTEGIIGLVIGTRPDCIDDNKLSYLKELSHDHYIIVEYGLESCYDKTLARINRGHSFKQSVEALKKTKQFGLKSGVHMIFGLPGETRDEMLKQAEILSNLPIDNIKFHQLQLLKGTSIAKEFRESPKDFIRFTLDEYIEFIIDFVEKLNPSFVIERFAGEVPPRFLELPGWGLVRNDQILNRIEKRMLKRETWQGKCYFVETSEK
jgi:radical SAM protein (TIGR01212 family)